MIGMLVTTMEESVVVADVVVPTHPTHVQKIKSEDLDGKVATWILLARWQTLVSFVVWIGHYYADKLCWRSA